MLTRTLVCTTVLLGIGATAALADHKNNLRPVRAFEMLDVDNDGALTVEEYRAGSQDEERDKAEANFRSIDKDDDDRLSVRELREGWTTANNVLRKDVYDRGEISGARVQEAAFLGLDADGDDFIALEEYRAGTKNRAERRVDERFRDADENDDQRLSRDELNKGWESLHGELREEVYLGEGAAEGDAATAAAVTMEGSAFDTLDEDRDGSLSEAEYRAGLRPRSRDRADRMFRLIDDDRDDQLSREEFAEEWARFDDLLRPEVYDPAPTAAAIERAEEAPEDSEVGPIFQRLDRNDDGELTLKEFRAGVRKQSRDAANYQFKKMDQDNDRRLSPDEFRSDWIWVRDQSGKKK